MFPGAVREKDRPTNLPPGRRSGSTPPRPARSVTGTAHPAGRHRVSLLPPRRHERTIAPMQEFAPYGVWVPIRAWPSDPRQIAEAAAEIESLGYGSVWLGGSPPDDLTLAEAILAATS